MNYLTGKYAVSLFPRTTFLHRATHFCQDTSRQVAIQREWMEKYRERGFSVVEAIHQLPDVVEGNTWRRCVGDKLCWVLPYARTGPYALHLELSPPYDAEWSPGMPTQQSPAIRPYAFEVLDVRSGVVAAHAAVRVAPRFYYRWEATSPHSH